MVKRLQVVVQSTIFLTALGGLLATLSFAPFNWPLVGWLAPWPMYLLARRHFQSIKRLMLAGMLVAFFICTFAFYWTVHLFVVYGGLPLWMSVFVFFIHTFLLNLKIPLFMIGLGLLYRSRFRRVRASMLVLIPLWGTVVDMVTPQIFNWYWGNAVAGNPILVQIGDLVGIHGITFAFFAVSYGAYRFARVLWIGLRHRPLLGGLTYLGPVVRRPLMLRRYAGVAVLLVLWFVYGLVQKGRYESLQRGLPKVRVAAIQPDAPLEQHGEHRVTPDVIHGIMADTIPAMADEAMHAAGGSLDLLVLPESAVPYYTTQNNFDTRYNNLYSEDFERMIVQLGSRMAAPVFFNEIGLSRVRDPKTHRERLDAYNSASLFGPDGLRKATYNKRILIAFGEQIPLASFLDRTGLIMLVPESVRYSRFRPGDDFVFMPYSATGNFLPLICYELLDPEYVRDFVRAGESDFIVNVTQDRWYGRTVETFQHYELGRIRAVETRKAIVRSTNSGTSGMVDLAGNYARPLYGPIFTGQEEKAVQVFDVPVNRADPTVFVRFGNAWLALPAAAWLGLLLFSLSRRRKRA